MRRIVGFAVAGLFVIVLAGCTTRSTTFRSELRSVEPTIAPKAVRAGSAPRSLTTHLAKKDAPLPQPVYRPRASSSGGSVSRQEPTGVRRPRPTFTPPDFGDVFQRLPGYEDDDDV